MTGRVAIYTLGCKVNQYESEALWELLEKEGLERVTSKADACIVNTCAVTAESERKARQTVRKAVRENPGAYILVTGCASQLAADSFSKIHGVHFVNGNRDKKALVGYILSYLEGNPRKEGREVDDLSLRGYEAMDLSTFGRTRAYMKVEDGCENRCAYCIIPAARGPVCSRPPEDCLREARALVSAGYREIVLTGIEISEYGSDLEHTDLTDLLTELDGIENLERIRLSSVDPSYLRPSVIDRLASLGCLAPHFHLSLQSGCDETLKRMRRKYNTQQVKRNLDYMRKKLPDVRFTSDVIVGFPGETEEDFETTCKFLQGLELLHVHVFAYSRRPGTEADHMDGQVEEQIKRERSARLISLCDGIRDAVLGKEEGKVYEVLFESSKDGAACGHTANFIEVRVKTGEDLRGKFRKVKLDRPEKGVMSGKLLEEQPIAECSGLPYGLDGKE